MFIQIGNHFFNLYEIRDFYYVEQSKRIIVKTRDGIAHFINVPPKEKHNPQGYLQRIVNGIKTVNGGCFQ